MTADAERRADRLLRWYPKSWRARYGDEFTELLIADITERPLSRSRTFDVARGGVVARLAAAGLGGSPATVSGEPAERVRVSLAGLALCGALFLAFATPIWAQLTVGWQWSAPDATATYVAMALMSTSMLAFGALATAALAPVVWTAVSLIATKGRASGVLGPALLFGACTVLVIMGGRHFGNGWPGTGGHRWIHQGLVPGGLAAFVWASTLSVSSFWVHPAVLASLPAAELAWMTVSPLAVAGTVGGAITIIRRTTLSPRLLRFQARLGLAACVTMTAFVSGCLAWLVDGGPGPDNLFHTGAIDVAIVTVLSVALAIGQRTARAAHASAVGLTTSV